jgi:TolA-binding protein
MQKAILTLAAVAFAAAAPLAAQSIGQQQRSQEQRIRQGERSGELTPTEARRLQFLEERVRRIEHRMHARSGGRLSFQERHELMRMEQQDSAEIYRLKHNRRVD